MKLYYFIIKVWREEEMPNKWFLQFKSCFLVTTLANMNIIIWTVCLLVNKLIIIIIAIFKSKFTTTSFQYSFN